MTDDTIYDHADPMFHESRVDEAFRDGAASMRELLARFVEQSGDTATAASIRLNWHPGFGADPGQIAGELPVDAWGMTQEMFERGRARTYAAIARATAIVAAVNAIAPYTAHIDAQAERIAELERDNARLRKGLDLLERQCAAVANSRSATDNIRFMLSQGLMRARVALKDTAQ